MSDELSSAFGEDFASKFQSEVQRRRERRNSVDDETMAYICARAINEDEFDGGDPQFMYTDDTGIKHNVLLMQVPDLEDQTVYTYANQLESGAVSMPLDFMGEWYSCLFNGGTEEVRELEEGSYYLVVGNLDTYENDNGDTKHSLSPVRGWVDVEEARRLAEKVMEHEDGFPPSDEEEEDDVPSFGSSDDSSSDDEDDSSSDDSGGGFLGSDDDEDEDEGSDIPEDEVHAAIDTLSEKDERVWEVTEDDQERLERLEIAVSESVGVDQSNELSNMILNYIESQQEDEDEEEDDDDALFS